MTNHAVLNGIDHNCSNKLMIALIGGKLINLKTSDRDLVEKKKRAGAVGGGGEHCGASRRQKVYKPHTLTVVEM